MPRYTLDDIDSTSPPAPRPLGKFTLDDLDPQQPSLSKAEAGAELDRLAKSSPVVRPPSFDQPRPTSGVTGAAPKPLAEKVADYGASVWKAATKPVPQAVYEATGHGDQYRGFGDYLEQGNAQLDRDLEKGVDAVFSPGTYAKQKANFAAPINLVNEGVKAGLGALEFGTSPAGLVAPKLPKMAQPAGAAALSASMVPEVSRSVGEAWDNPNAETVPRALVQTGMAFLPVAHGGAEALAADRSASDYAAAKAKQGPPLPDELPRDKHISYAAPEPLNRQQRRASAAPPEIGAEQPYVLAEHDRLAEQLGVGPFEQLSPEDQQAVRDLAAGRSNASPAASAPAVRPLPANEAAGQDLAPEAAAQKPLGRYTAADVAPEQPEVSPVREAASVSNAPIGRYTVDDLAVSARETDAAEPARTASVDTAPPGRFTAADLDPLQPPREQRPETSPEPNLQTPVDDASAAGSELPETVDRRHGEHGAITIPASTVQAVQDARLTARTKFLDRYAPIEDLAERGPLPPEENPYVAARLFGGKTHGQVWAKLEKDLRGIVRPAAEEGLYDATRQHALYERFEELAQRGITKFPGDKTIQQLSAEKAALEQQLGPQKLARVQQFGSQLRDYSNTLLQESYAAGVISQKAYQSILAANHKYLPLLRLEHMADQVENARAGSNVFSVARQNLFKTIEGSDKELLDPIQGIVHNTQRAVNLIERNRVATKVADLAARPEWQGVVERVPASGQVPAGMGKFSVLRNGVKEEYAVPKPVADSMRHLTEEQVDLVTRMARASASALRAGATSLNIGFILPNAWRDFKSATLVSEVGFTPLDWARGFSEAIRKGPEFRAYMESGAGFSGFFEGKRSLPGAIEKLTENPGKRMVKTALNPIEWIRQGGEIIELAPRIGVYQRNRAQGGTPTESAFNSRNATVDFSKSGTTMRVLNQWVPFLNARLQGTANMFGAVKDHPLRSGAILAATVGVPTITTYLHNTRQHREIWDDIAGFEKDNNILIIYGDGRDEKGNPTQVWKLPKADMDKAYGNPLENFLAYLDGRDRKSLAQLALQVGSDLAPVPFERNGEWSGSAFLSGTLPPAVKAGVEWTTNRNLFSDRNVVPENLTKASPAEQYTADTPAPLVKAGRLLGVSPLKIKNTIETQFGGVGKQVTAVASGKPGEAGQQISGRFTGAHGGEQEAKSSQQVRQLEQQEADARVIADRNAVKLHQELGTLAPEQRQRRLQQAIESGELNEHGAKKLLQLLEQPAQPSRTSNLLRHEPVKVRARYILQQLQQQPAEKRGAVLEKMAADKLLTPAVIEAMTEELAHAH